MQGVGALGEGLLELTGNGDLDLSNGTLRGPLPIGMAHRRFLIDNKGLKEAKAPKAAFVS